MSTRKTRFEVVPLSAIAPLLGEIQEAGANTAPKPARILSVTYDRSLGTTREMLFARAGFQVSSAWTLGQAVRLCAAAPFDLIVIGHSIPIEERELLLKELRSQCSAPVLALYRIGEPPLIGANYLFDSAESPAHLLETVVDILKPKPGPGPRDKSIQ
jgi:DNA-binding NtrC family response regulator